MDTQRNNDRGINSKFFAPCYCLRIQQINCSFTLMACTVDVILRLAKINQLQTINNDTFYFLSLKMTTSLKPMLQSVSQQQSSVVAFAVTV